MTTVDLLALTAKILGAGLVLQTLELAWNWRALQRGRILHWGAWELFLSPRPLAPTRALMGFRPTLAALAGRLAAGAGVLCLPFAHGAVPWLLGALLVLQLHHHARFAMLPNTDTMFLYALVAVALGATGRPRLQSAGLVFLAAQLMLAYATTGVTKLRLRGWRTGEHLIAALRDSEFRRPRLACWLAHHPGIARAGAWLVIALQLALALGVLLPPPAFFAVLALGGVFHLSVAALLGLNGFLWSFGAGYPALVFVHQLVHR